MIPDAARGLSADNKKAGDLPAFLFALRALTAYRAFSIIAGRGSTPAKAIIQASLDRVFVVAEARADDLR